MELIAWLLVLFFLFKIISSSKSKKDVAVTSILKNNNRHGHRCYIEHLTQAEREIVALLATNLDHKEYFIFNNIILPSEKTTTTQIDHIVVSRYGIFVIESKKYNGWIYAHKNRREWTQTFKTGLKHHFHNPILQNFAHISALKEQMPFVGNRFFSVIAFSGDCEFKTPRINNVLYEEELVPFIQSQSEIKFKEVELLVIIGKLSMLCQTIDVSNEEHSENIANAIETKFRPYRAVRD